MVAFNFSPEFAPLVEARIKRQTIRRSDRVRVGQQLQLYTGQRTAACRKLVTPDPVCTVTTYVHLSADDIVLGSTKHAPRGFDEFARADGFRDYAEMWRWFSSRYEVSHFRGRLIKWDWPETLESAP